MTDFMFPWWGWFLFGFLLLLLELASPGGFYFLFFGVGALVVGFVAFLGLVEAAWVQLTVFSIVSVAALLLFRRRLHLRFAISGGDAIVDSLVGEAATVTDNIEAGGFGKVELRGTSWTAKNSGSRMLARGERCTVQRIEGLSLWVIKEE